MNKNLTAHYDFLTRCFYDRQLIELNAYLPLLQDSITPALHIKSTYRRVFAI